GRALRARLQSLLKSPRALAGADANGAGHGRPRRGVEERGQPPLAPASSRTLRLHGGAQLRRTRPALEMQEWPRGHLRSGRLAPWEADRRSGEEGSVLTRASACFGGVAGGAGQ